MCCGSPLNQSRFRYNILGYPEKVHSLLNLESTARIESFKATGPDAQLREKTQQRHCTIAKNPILREYRPTKRQFRWKFQNRDNSLIDLGLKIGFAFSIIRIL